MVLSLSAPLRLDALSWSRRYSSAKPSGTVTARSSGPLRRRSFWGRARPICPVPARICRIQPALRVLLDDTLHNLGGCLLIESHPRHFLSFRRRGSTGFKILLNKPGALQTLWVGFRQREFPDAAHATIETADVSVGGRRLEQCNRGDGDSHADRRSDIGETHPRIVSPRAPEAKGLRGAPSGEIRWCAAKSTKRIGLVRNGLLVCWWPSLSHPVG